MDLKRGQYWHFAISQQFYHVFRKFLALKRKQKFIFRRTVLPMRSPISGKMAVLDHKTALKENCLKVKNVTNQNIRAHFFKSNFTDKYAKKIANLRPHYLTIFFKTFFFSLGSKMV